MEQELRAIAEPGPEARPPDLLPGERPVIRAACALFACRVCRTKNGWRHQIWCASAGVDAPECADCIYWAKNSCKHPARRACRSRGKDGSPASFEMTGQGKTVISR